MRQRTSHRWKLRRQQVAEKFEGQCLEYTIGSRAGVRPEKELDGLDQSIDCLISQPTSHVSVETLQAFYIVAVYRCGVAL